MESINLRQLRDTRRLKAMLRRGQAVELRERSQVLARIMPVNGESVAPSWPDFVARARTVSRSRMTAVENTVVEERRRARF